MLAGIGAGGRRDWRKGTGRRWRRKGSHLDSFRVARERDNAELERPTRARGELPCGGDPTSRPSSVFGLEQEQREGNAERSERWRERPSEREQR